MKTTRLMALILSILMTISVMPTNIFAAPSAVEVADIAVEETPASEEVAEISAEAEPVKTKFVKVHSLDEIVPNQRYIIVGSYYNETTGETSYHAMGKENSRNDGFRYSYAEDQNGTHYMDISEDVEEIIVYSYPAADHDPILKVRLRPYGYKFDGHAFYFRADNVENKGYLCGYSSSTSHGANGHHYHSSMPIYEHSYTTAGDAWWYVDLPEEGENEGHWQILSRCQFKTGGSYTYEYSVMKMGAPYPNTGGQFRTSEAYPLDVGEIEDDARIQYIKQVKTNICLYREVCEHIDSDVTHAEAVSATCTKAGNTEYWYCAGCETYTSKEDFSDKISVADTFIAPLPHDSSCSHSEEAKFEIYKATSMGSNQTGERYLLVSKSGDKYYAMGNVTNADGTRNAVEVSISEYGIITATSDRAEFLVYDFDENGFKDDGNYLSAIDGKIITYAPGLAGANGYIPIPARFSQDSYDTGAGAFLAWSTFDTDDEYIVFDEENLVFKAQSEEVNNTYRYRELCPHEKVYTPAVDATCTEQGVVENWYCETCCKYFADEEGAIPLLDEYEGPEALTLNATGHDFDEDDICKNCSMKRHVYSQISSLTEFDALSGDASYIIVFKDADKTYAACLPASDGFPCDTDSDGDGIVDDLETDENANTVPDCIEWLFENWGMGDMNGDGVVDVIDYNEFVRDRDEDGDVDFDDYAFFYEENYPNFRMRYEDEALMLDNFVEVTPKDDGTIVITDEGAMEFQLMQAGVWGGAPYDEEYLETDLEEAGFAPETVRIRAAWVPNIWVGNSGRMGAYGKEHFSTSYRVYGDFEYPGIVDMKNWKISFNEDGTAVLVATWSYYDDTGALRLVKFVNDNEQADMTIVALPEEEWEYSPIMSAYTASLPAYLYASEAVFEERDIEIDLGTKADSSNVRYIEIDGIQTEISEDNDKYTVETGNENALVEVVEKTRDGVFVESQYFYIDTTRKTATKLGLDSYMQSYDETSVRTKKDSGVRFKSVILTDAKSEEIDYCIDEYGFVVASEEILADSELTLDFHKIATGVAYNRENDIDRVFDSQIDGQHVFTGVVINVPARRYKTNLVCKTYTKITIKGQQFVVYGEPVTGNIYDTAKSILENDEPDDTTKAALEKIISDYDTAVAEQ